MVKWQKKADWGLVPQFADKPGEGNFVLCPYFKMNIPTANSSLKHGQDLIDYLCEDFKEQHCGGEEKVDNGVENDDCFAFFRKFGPFTNTYATLDVGQVTNPTISYHSLFSNIKG